MLYKVLKTCTVNNRYCREGEVVEFAQEVVNKYLSPLGDGEKKPETVKNKDAKPLSSLNHKPEIKTGMAAKRKKGK